MRFSRPLASTAALLLALASTASALSCGPASDLYVYGRADTLDKVTPVLVVTSYWKDPAGIDGNPPREHFAGTDTISPARLLADLARQGDLHRDAFIGQIVGIRNQSSMRPDGRVVIEPVDTLDVEVEAVFKGNMSLGTHRFIDSVPEWERRFTQLEGRRMLWFRGWAGNGKPPVGRRLAGTVGPNRPCGRHISGHPILPDGRVTRGGNYEDFGVGVSLTTVLQTFNGVTSRLKADRTGSEGTGPAVIRGGGVPFVLFTQGNPGPSGDAVSVDGRRHSLDALAP